MPLKPFKREKMIKKTIIKTVTLLSRLIPLNWLQKAAARKLVVVNYHSLLNADADPFINQNPYRTLEEFEQDLIFFKKNYHIVSLPEILESYSSNIPLNINSLTITFDDGLGLLFDQIRPILLKHNIPAAFFLNPEFVDNKNLHYKRKINLIIQTLKSKPQLETSIDQVLSDAGIQSNDRVGKLLSLGFNHQTLIDQIGKELNINFADFATKHAIYLTSSQIRMMINEGFHFGGHSWNHPDYKTIDIDEQERQTVSSVDWVTREFELSYRIFAFPYRDYHVGKELFDRISTNMDLTFGTHGMVDDTAPCHIQRVDVERSRTEASTAMKINYMKYLIQIMTGKGILRRK